MTVPPLDSENQGPVGKNPHATPPVIDSNKDESQSGTPPPEPVWTYRGYQLRASEFNTAMVHFHRAEVQRANVWRQRLDTTTNWAVVTTGAVLSFAFTQMNSPHFVIPLNLILVTLFLTIEARRYRYYELWSYRVRLMETDFFAAMLVPPFQPAADWADALAENLLHPQFTISYLEAFGRRLRRNYLWIYAVIFLSWFIKLWSQPVVAQSLGEFTQRASIGTIPGGLVISLAILFYLWLVFLSIATLNLHQSSGEVIPRYGGSVDRTRLGSRLRAWFRPSRHRQQLLTFIITDKALAVGSRILKEMGRGVTSMPGVGMYSRQSHSVLMCALTVTEVPMLKSLVMAEDEKAFVIVSPAQEVFGRGFMPLEDQPG